MYRASFTAWKLTDFTLTYTLTLWADAITGQTVAEFWDEVGQC
jgi:hypothetical protein